MPLICFDKFFECLDGSVGGELLELLVVFDLVKFKIVADGAENGERNAVHIAHMTHGGTLHLTAKRAKFKGDVFALHAVGDKDVAGGNSAGHHVGAESLTAFRKLLGKGFVEGLRRQE